MGADGNIYIWKRSEVEKIFPHAESMFNRLPTHYKHELCGEIYDHVYAGDNLMCCWEDSGDWYGDSGGVADDDSMKEFVEWLSKHSTHWEVWT